MNEKYSNNEIYIMLKNLSQKINDGFDGTHKRLDITNTKVIKNTEWRLKTEGSLSVIKYLVGIIGFATIINVVVNFFK